MSAVPASASVSVFESASILKVSFNAPENMHGSNVSKYQIEWYDTPQVQDVKRLTITDTQPIRGTFRLTYNGDITDYLWYNSSSDVLRTALESLSSIRSVQVSRSSPNTGYGYVWTITFLQDFPSNINPPLSLAVVTTPTGSLTSSLTLTSLSSNAVATVTSADLPHGYGVDFVNASVGVVSYAYVIQNLVTVSDLCRYSLRFLLYFLTVCRIEICRDF